MFYQIFLARLFSLVNCKAWHWNLGIGNGKGNGFGIGTVVTEAIISISIIVMESKLSRVVIQDRKSPSTKSRDTSILWSREEENMCYLNFHKVYGLETQPIGDLE